MGSASSASSKSSASGGHSSERLKLIYFDTKYRAELIRLILSAGNLSFEDYRIQPHEWKERKEYTPFGCLPILEYGDEVVISESRAVARFAARMSGLAGKTDVEEAYADMITEHAWGFMDAVLKAYKTESTEEKEAASDNILNNVLPLFLSRAEKQLKKRGGKYFAGTYMTYGDVAMTDIVMRLRDPDDSILKALGHEDERTQLIKEYPLLEEVADRVVEESPGIKAWIEKQK